MIRTFHNYRIESAGRKVKLYRYENLDVTVTRYRRKTLSMCTTTADWPLNRCGFVPAPRMTNYGSLTSERCQK